jgi:hypothetical protein
MVRAHGGMPHSTLIFCMAIEGKATVLNLLLPNVGSHDTVNDKSIVFAQGDKYSFHNL